MRIARFNLIILLYTLYIAAMIITRHTCNIDSMNPIVSLNFVIDIPSNVYDSFDDLRVLLKY